MESRGGSSPSSSSPSHDNATVHSPCSPSQPQGSHRTSSRTPSPGHRVQYHATRRSPGPQLPSLSQMNTRNSKSPVPPPPPPPPPQSKPRRRRIRSELDRLLSDEGTRNMLRGLRKHKKKKVSVGEHGVGGAGVNGEGSNASSSSSSSSSGSSAASRRVADTNRATKKNSNPGSMASRTRNLINRTSMRGASNRSTGVSRRPVVIPSAPTVKRVVKPTHGNNSADLKPRTNGPGAGSVSPPLRSGTPGSQLKQESVTTTSQTATKLTTKVDPKYVVVSKRGNVAWITVVNGGSGGPSVSGSSTSELKKTEDSCHDEEVKSKHQQPSQQGQSGGKGSGGVGGTSGSGSSATSASAASVANNGAFGLKVLQSLECAFRHVELDPSISVVVLQNSHSRYFCRGIDVNELLIASPPSSPSQPQQPSQNKHFHFLNSSHLHNSGSTSGTSHLNPSTLNSRLSVIVKAIKCLLSTLICSTKVLVASVTGDCVGFGVMFLPLFDFVYANDKSVFRAHYNGLGQSPECIGLLQSLLTGASANKVASFVYLNTPFTGTEAVSMGLVHETLWPARYNEELYSRVHMISSQSALIRATKRTVRSYTLARNLELLWAEWDGIEKEWGTRGFQDRARAFLNRTFVNGVSNRGVSTKIPSSSGCPTNQPNASASATTSAQTHPGSSSTVLLNGQ